MEYLKANKKKVVAVAVGIAAGVAYALGLDPVEAITFVTNLFGGGDVQ